MVHRFSNDPDPLDFEPHDRHWIRLRGPWEVTWLAPAFGDPTEPAIASDRVNLPAEWRDLFGEQSGTARFSRRFQKPTNLGPDERVIITLCDVGCAAIARLNGSPLEPLTDSVGDPADAPSEDVLSFDVTDRVLATNTLELELTVTADQLSSGKCGLWRPVFLEIIDVA